MQRTPVSDYRIFPVALSGDKTKKVGGKRCYGFKADTRFVEMQLDMNPIIGSCMNRIFQNPDGEKLKEEIRQYLSKNEL